MAEAALVKGLGGAGIVGASGAGGYLVYESYSRNTVEKALIEKGLKILGFGDENNSKWQEMAAAYKSSGGEDADKEGGFIGEKVKDVTKSKDRFESACKKALASQFINTEDENFRNASRWCVEKETVQQTLEKEGFEFIKDDGEWETAATTVTSKGVKKGSDNYTKDTLKEDCTSKKAIETTSKNYWEDRKFVVDYCEKPKTK